MVLNGHMRESCKSRPVPSSPRAGHCRSLSLASYRFCHPELETTGDTSAREALAKKHTHTSLYHVDQADVTGLSRFRESFGRSSPCIGHRASESLRYGKYRES